MPSALKSRIANWTPVEIDGLEDAAEVAVRGLTSGIVVAGPGAGKTELLAQRACFLFQTGLCPDPYRVLAISFKRDAASNLRRRVRRRCGMHVARRFDSLTYDSFGKSLVDRFLPGLPELFRPTSDYTIDVELDRAVKLRAILGKVRGAIRSRAQAVISGGFEELFFRRDVVGAPIRVTPVANPTDNEVLAREVWRVLLAGDGKSVLSFSMIGRLAELLLRTNPKVLAALRATYQYVFLDEFQDTTQIQYQLTTTAFKGSNARLTAVGDPKQRIMLWAGALVGVFDDFRKDFGAKHHHLAMNYRSAPELVRIQQHLIQALEPSAKPSTAFRKSEDGDGECRIFSYPDDSREAIHLAEYLAALIADEGLRPCDICVLTRTWNDKYSSQLIEELAKRDVPARSERELQDLLAEPLVKDSLCLLRLAVSPRSPGAWADLTDLCIELWGIDDAARVGTVERELSKAAKLIRKLMEGSDRSEESTLSLLQAIVELIGKNALKQAYPQYRQGTFFDDTLRQLRDQLHARLSKGMAWLQSLDDLEGTDCIPIMTVHKSKGLEYDTVVFVGLEDSTFWNFRKSPDEEKCAFFVAFSRAIKRVIFTYSAMRPRNIGGQPERQSRTTIGSLYSLLEAAGVTVEQVR